MQLFSGLGIVLSNVLFSFCLFAAESEKCFDVKMDNTNEVLLSVAEAVAEQNKNGISLVEGANYSFSGTICLNSESLVFKPTMVFPVNIHFFNDVFVLSMGFEIPVADGCSYDFNDESGNFKSFRTTFDAKSVYNLLIESYVNQGITEDIMNHFMSLALDNVSTKDNKALQDICASTGEMFEVIQEQEL